MNATTEPKIIHGFANGRSSGLYGTEFHEGPIPRERVLEHIGFPLDSGPLRTEVTIDGTPTIIEDTGRKVVVRTDTQTVLGAFSGRYQIHPPKEWCLRNLELLADGGLHISTSMVLRGGAVVAVQAENPGEREAREGVKYRPWIMAVTSMDGSIATTYVSGVTALACENALGVALYREKDAAKVRVRHTSNSLGRIVEMRARLDIVLERVGDAFDEQVRQLTDQYVSDAQFAEIVKRYTGVEVAKEGRSLTMARGKQDALETLWREDDRVAPWRNSAYGVLAAFNTARHHLFGADKERGERNALLAAKGEWEKFDARVLQMAGVA